MSQSFRNPIRIGAVEFDPHMRTVDVAGRKTVLDARSSSIFLALAERLGECVNKDALMRAGWPTQLVHENSLAKAVSKLRRALNGSGLEIAAIYGLGYSLRHEAVVQPAAGSEAPETSMEPSDGQRPRWLSPMMIPLSLAMLTVAVLVFIVTGQGRSVPIRDVPPITNDAPNSVATILWVDDHPANNRLEVQLFRQNRIAVHLAESTADALKLLAVNRYDLVISDLGRGEDRLAGLEMTQAMKQRGANVPVIIYTVRPKDASGQAAQRKLVADAGAADLAVTPQEVRAKVLQRLVP